MPRAAPAPAAVVAAVSVALAPGCAQVLGIDDPAALHPLTSAVDGDYVLRVRADATTHYQFVAEVVADERRRELALTLTPLLHDATASTETTGDAHVFVVPVANLPERDFEVVDTVLAIPAAAAPDGQTTRIVSLTIKGRFPSIAAQSTDDAFCGDLSGTVSVPVEQPFNQPFAAVKIEAGAALPATVKRSCAELP